MKVLVTGYPGWVGRRLVEILNGTETDFKSERGMYGETQIRCLVQPTVPLDPPSAGRSSPSIIRGDLTDPAALDRFFEDSEGALVFHLAAVIHARRFVSEFHEANVRGTRNLLEAASRHKVRKVVAVSSSVPLGVNRTRDGVFTEEAPYHPYLEYGRSKMLMEELVNEAFRKGRMETVIVRPCRVYGPRPPDRFIRFLTLIQKGMVPVVGDGQNRQSMCYVDHLCQGLLRAGAVARSSGRTYWIADERPYTMMETIETVRRVFREDFGCRVPDRCLRLPGLTSRLAYGADWLLQRAGLYVSAVHMVSEMDKTIACSIQRAREELGYDPRVSLDEGIRRSIRWGVENGSIDCPPPGIGIKS